MAFAAEEARLKGTVIHMSDFRDNAEKITATQPAA
jgi:hypothetical protein